MGTRLADKVALVTGGASGIGRATALLFGQEGAHVGIIDRDEAEGGRVADTIASGGGEAVFVRADVGLAQEAQEAVDTVARRFGRLDILFNNAGISQVGALHETTEADWDRVMATNRASRGNRGCRTILGVGRVGVCHRRAFDRGRRVHRRP